MVTTFWSPKTFSDQVSWGEKRRVRYHCVGVVWGKMLLNLSKLADWSTSCLHRKFDIIVISNINILQNRDPPRLFSCFMCLDAWIGVTLREAISFPLYTISYIQKHSGLMWNIWLRRNLTLFYSWVDLT